MTPETGNNFFDEEIKRYLSIQLSLNGLSYSVARTNLESTRSEIAFDPKLDMIHNLEEVYRKELIPLEDYGYVELMLDTDRLVLVPRHLFAPELAQGYLDLNSVPVYDGETVVYSTRNMIRCVLPYRTDVVEWFKEQYGPLLTFSSPIVESIMRPQRGSVELNLTRENLYLSVFDNVLLFAEVFPYKSMADILYYLGVVQQLYDIEHNSILVVGYNSEDVAMELGKYYRDVIGDAYNKRES